MAKRPTTHETRQAKHPASDHEHVSCAKCGELLSSPHQATHNPQAPWARECSWCGDVTQYAVESESGR